MVTHCDYGYSNANFMSASVYRMRHVRRALLCQWQLPLIRGERLSRWRQFNAVMDSMEHA